MRTEYTLTPRGLRVSINPKRPRDIARLRTLGRLATVQGARIRAGKQFSK